MSVINTELSIRRPRQLTGTLLTFKDSNIYNTRDNPGTGDFSVNYTNANLGVTQKVYHQDSVAPTLPASWIPATNSDYFTNDLNILYVEYIGNEQAEYWWAREEIGAFSKLEVEEVDSSFTLTDFEKVYSLGGTTQPISGSLNAIEILEWENYPVAIPNTP